MRSIQISQKFKRNYVPIFVPLVLFVIGGVSGILLQKYYPVGQLLKVIRISNSVSAEIPNLQTLANSPVRRVEVPLSRLHSQRIMVALVFGQSNSANSGETRLKTGKGVYNFYKGKLYEAQDPLLGATREGGSVWTRLGGGLIVNKQYESVVFVPIGVGGTAIARWKSDGDLHPILLQAIRDVEAQGLTITHLLWHQGESDAKKGTTKSDYKRAFLDMLSSIRKQGVTAPIYVSVATRCAEQRPDEQIRQAQQELVNQSQGIYAGPDTDQLGFCYRYDGCHFTTEGLKKFADLWLHALR